VNRKCYLIYLGLIGITKSLQDLCEHISTIRENKVIIQNQNVDFNNTCFKTWLIARANRSAHSAFNADFNLFIQFEKLFYLKPICLYCEYI